MGRANTAIRQPTPCGSPPIEAGERAVRFINNLTHTSGEFGGQPFNLRPWQEAIIRKIFGTTRPDGKRQYRTVYIELPRKNGKSELCAAIALYMLMGDGEIGAQVYSAASNQEQASLVFDVAAQMCINDEKLMKLASVVDSKKRIVFHKTGSFYRAISSESKSKHGFNASAIIYDELHAAPNRDLLDVLSTSMGARKQPLIVYITTAGHDKNSVCYEMHDYAERVRDGIVKDDTFLPVIFAANDNDDWKDEATWFKANPALGDFRDLEEMRQVFRRAVEIPAQQNTFKRLYLNIWTEQETRWLPMEHWADCGNLSHVEAELRKKECVLGIDLSTKIDLTSITVMFPPADRANGIFSSLTYFFMPEETIRQREKTDKVPYRRWAELGFIKALPGETLDYGHILRFINEDLAAKFYISAIGYDIWNANQFALELDKHGYKTKGIGQGTKALNEPTKEFEALVVSKRLAHGDNPVLTWQASHVTVKSDSDGNYKPVKPKMGAGYRIDGISSHISALAACIANPDVGKDMMGLMVL